MTTLYAVTSGEYPDCHVAALYSTKEQAQQHIARYEQARQAGVSEWLLPHPQPKPYQLDPEPLPAPQVYWCAAIDLESGYIQNTTSIAYRPLQELEVFDQSTEPDCDLAPTAYARSCKSPQHAQQLALKAQQRWRRSQSGTKSPTQPANPTPPAA